MQDLVSVVIPSFNRAATICRAVDSVINQTYKNIEVIIVDDCSTDNTDEVIRKQYQKQKNVIYEKLKKNSGACVARNRGIDLSRGAYIAFLDSDDAFYPEKIAKQMALLKETNYDLCATDYRRIDQYGNETTIKVIDAQGEELYKNLLYCNFITTGTLIGKKECFFDTKFDESLPRYQDWDLVLRLCQKYQFCFINEPTIIQEFQKNSITSSTSHEKTYNAMRTIYEKNKHGFEKCKKANTQFMWLMGYHSMFVADKKSYELLWYGAICYGIKIRRILIVIMFKLGFDSLVEKFFVQ